MFAIENFSRLIIVRLQCASTPPREITYHFGMGEHLIGSRVSGRTETTLDEGRPLRTCVQRQEQLIPARVPACAWDVFPAIDLSWRELVALPLRDTRSKTSQTIRRPPDE